MGNRVSKGKKKTRLETKPDGTVVMVSTTSLMPQAKLDPIAKLRRQRDNNRTLDNQTNDYSGMSCSSISTKCKSRLVIAPTCVIAEPVSVSVNVSVQPQPRVETESVQPSLVESTSDNDIYVTDACFVNVIRDSECTGEESNECSVMKAAYNFIPTNADELAFDMGDRIMLVERISEGATWLMGRNLTKAGSLGYVPYSYLVRDEDVPQSHEAWFDYTRAQAHRALLMPGVRDGTYIVRPQGDIKYKETTTDVVLCVRYHDPEGVTYVRQFKVSFTADSGSKERKWRVGRHGFGQFSNLVSHYSKEALAKCCALTQPYPRTFAPPSRFRDFEVSREQVTVQELLGKGSFGEVYRAVYCKCLPVAVKMLQEGRMSVDEFLKEAQAMYRLSHKNVVQLLGVCTKDTPIYIITELMEHGSLLEFLRLDAKAQPEPTLSPENLIDILAQVACGMDYLEVLSYVHCDLRAANILLSADNTAKVADFGLAKLCESDGHQFDEHTKFPVKWTAPEACLHRKYSSKSDVWSFGVVCFEVATRGGVPYQGMSGTETFQYVYRGGRMKRPTGLNYYCPEELYTLIMVKCWDENPAVRPTFRECLEFLSNFTCTAAQSTVKAAVNAGILKNSNNPSF